MSRQLLDGKSVQCVSGESAGLVNLSSLSTWSEQGMTLNDGSMICSFPQMVYGEYATGSMARVFSMLGLDRPKFYTAHKYGPKPAMSGDLLS